MADGDAFERRTHFAACLAFCSRKVDFDEDVDEALPGLVADGRVAADDCFAGDGVAEAQHEVLAYGETEGLGGVVEGEGEDARVPGDGFFGVEDGAGPGFGVEEGWAGGSGV